MPTCAEIKTQLQSRRLPTLQCALVPSETPSENAMRLPTRAKYITPFDAMRSLYAFTTADATNPITASKYAKSDGGNLSPAAATTCISNTDVSDPSYVLVSFTASATSLQGSRQWIITVPDCPGGTIPVGIVKPIITPDFSLMNKTTGLRYSGRGRSSSVSTGGGGGQPPTPVQPPSFIVARVTGSSSSSRIVGWTRVYVSSEGYTPTSATSSGSSGSAYVPIAR